MGFHGDYTKHRRNIRIGKMGRVKSLGRQGPTNGADQFQSQKIHLVGGTRFDQYQISIYHLHYEYEGKTHRELTCGHLAGEGWNPHGTGWFQTHDKCGTEPPGGEVNHLTSNPKHLT